MSAPSDWVFLRGLGREQRHWEAFPEVFAATLGVRVHCLDLPGVGTECHRVAPTSIAATVDDLRARWQPLAAAHPERSWGIFGISLGGMVAQSWPVQYPGDFKRVVLVNTSAASHALPWERMSLSVARQALAAARSRSEADRQKRILKFTTRFVGDLDGVAARWAEYAAERPLKPGNFLRQLGAAMRFRAPAAIAAPTLVMVSEGDALAHPNNGRRLAAHYRAALAVHPSAGHDLPVDAPEWVCQTVSQWMASPG